MTTTTSKVQALPFTVLYANSLPQVAEMPPHLVVSVNYNLSGSHCSARVSELADVPDDVLRAFGWHPGIAKDAADGEWFPPHPTSLNTL